MSVSAGAAPAGGLESTGNTDGVLTWRLDTLAPGASARRVVLFAYDASHKGLLGLLEKARGEFAELPDPPPAKAARRVSPVWVRNKHTNFALEGPGHYFWEGKGQSLVCPRGGQLSRFGWYVHYAGGRAGTPIAGGRGAGGENLKIVSPMAAVAPDEAVGTVATKDGRLRVRIRAKIGSGTYAAVELVLTNTGEAALDGVKLSAYSNLEAAHDHENDYSVLDATTGGLLTVDPPTGIRVIMAGLKPPDSGYSGNWASQARLQSAAGIPAAKWKRFAGLSAELKKKLARSAPQRRRGIYAAYAPAPQTEPTEPPTRTLTAAEAAKVLEDDWLFQAEGKPLAARARQEILWARALARRLRSDPRTPDLAAELKELDALAAQDKPSGPRGDGGRGLYLAVRRVKRRIALKNPAVDFTRVLFIDNPFPQGREWRHQARHRDGMMAVPGGRLLVLDGLHPGGKLRKLAPLDGPASFWRPDLSFDARKVLFCMKPCDEKAFHLYEIGLDPSTGLGAGGTALRQLTDGDYDDTDPIYLPSGKIIFTTTRCNTYVRCMPYTYSYILARCDADGGNVYLISRSNEPDWCPALLNDGRVIYSRWEYTDKALWRIQSLWAIHQDGTNVSTFWGNQSVWPDHLSEARPIPGSRRVMFTGLAHHDWFAGSIGIIDPDRGYNFPLGLTKVTAETPWPECGRPPVDPIESPDYHTAGRFRAYKTPYPLGERDFLVSAWTADGRNRFVLYLMDTDGNRELIHQGAYNVLHAMPVRPRVVPPKHVDRVAWPGTGEDRKPPKSGVLFSSNVYQNADRRLAGEAKYLRVIKMDSKTYSLWTRDFRHEGPAVSYVQSEGVKRVLGTAPIEKDGSVHFQVPPGAAVHFQLIDEHYRALQTMRSFTGVMPGEKRGCVGCHELHSVTPVNTAGLAARREARKLTPPPWGTASISYGRMVQPVLDRCCGRCHQGDGNQKARGRLDLTLRPGRGVFTEPYLTLVGPLGYGLNKRKDRPPSIAGALMCENFAHSDPDSYATTPAMTYLSYTSKLIHNAMSGRHHDVKVDSESLRKLIGWVDCNCPYRGDEDVRALPDPSFAGIEKLPIRPRVKTAPRIPRP